MKVIYDRETDTLTVIFTETSVVESGEDKPGVVLDYDDKGNFVYSGNVGTGFDESLLNDLKGRMGKLVVSISPFGAKIPSEAATTWLKPYLVAEVKYAERTRDGILRQPVFLRLRNDKPAKEVKPQKVLT